MDAPLNHHREGIDIERRQDALMRGPLDPAVRSPTSRSIWV
jgi:hypothetical protein